MQNKYFALYVSTKDVLVFDNELERDDFVDAEQVVHPECIAASFDDVKELISGKTPEYDQGFGCMAILNN